MHVIGCQFDIVWEDKQANYRRVRELLGNQTVAPSSLVVLPEMFASGFSMNVNMIAEDENGATTEFLTRLAAELRSMVVGGLVTRAEDGRGLNEAVVAGPDGSVIGRYRKMHPFSYGGESEHYAAGHSFVLVRCGQFIVALFICYDLRFPEVFRIATRAGAQALLVIANWPAAREQHWTTLLRARAIENQAYVVGVNRTGSDPKLAYSGRSLVIDPRGQIIADAGAGEGLLEADLDLESLLQYRREFPALADARPEFLGQ
jgi:omega-amidase